ncbi:unnamed protein product [Periconia digitata]|uniref:Glucose N-acetyltransferase 1 n=1 Tax=Periconia digitata TaxID=1303443 RepID=A0A9W4UNY4_9PLEO|nr:unnamed protein product [Periconia digitata]
MRKRHSDELPRFLRDSSSSSNNNYSHGQSPQQWPRRYYIYVAILLLVCWLMYPSSSSHSLSHEHGVDSWNNYAYSLYASDSATLCHALLVFHALERFGSKAERVLFYPDYWDLKIDGKLDRDSQLLVEAKRRYKVKLKATKLLNVEGRSADAWLNTFDKSVTKFLAFSLTAYKRVIALDTDITLLAHLDDLFHLPATPMAMPRAYWYKAKPWPLSSVLMVLTPSLAELARFTSEMDKGADEALVAAHKFDMQLVNDRFEHSAMVIPHRPYIMLSGEFRAKNHSSYLGNTFEEWDPAAALAEARIVHFSDWPLPKPWIMWPHEGLAEMQPDCAGRGAGGCEDRRIWKELYGDFRKRRRDVCGYLSVPAPDWVSVKDTVHGDNATEGTGYAAPHVDDVEGKAGGSADSVLAEATKNVAADLG